MKLTLTMPGAPPLQNKRERMHYHARGKVRDHWYLLVLEALGTRRERIETCRVIYTRGYWNHPGDLDGVGASVKPILDALVKIGILPDDNPHHVTEYVVKQQKFKRKDLQTKLVIEHE